MDICSLGDYYYYREPIGHGSFSIIYKGFIYKTQTPIAVKKITKVIDKKYFLNEIETMKRLDHPNILKLYDVVYTREDTYLILEYCNGGDLQTYIKKKYTKYDSLFLKEILGALEYIYKNNILHRDIKPQNILIHNHTVKISDFGFAKSFELDELMQTYCGSPLYMAPELIYGQDYNFKSDIWSLGVIVYELFTKKHPYPVSTKEELIGLNKTGYNIDYSLVVNNYLRKFIEMLLDVSPNNRIGWDAVFSYSREYLEQFSISNPIPIKTDKCFIKKHTPNRISPLLKSTIINLGHDDEDIFKMDLDDPTTSYDNSPVFKPLPMSYSINIKHMDGQILTQDDCRVISRSAPNELSKSINNNYLSDIAKKDSIDNDHFPIIGTSPSTKPKGIGDMLDKSVKNIKHLFGFKL